MAAANRTGGPASQRRTAYFCPTTYNSTYVAARKLDCDKTVFLLFVK